MRGFDLTRGLLIVALVLSAFGSVLAEQIALRADFPAAPAGGAIPVAGGVPFPRGALNSPENVALVGADGAQLPCQVRTLAVWPDGSIKWLLVDTVLTAAQAGPLTLHYGPDVRRKAVEDPLLVETVAGGVRISGGAVSAEIPASGGAVLNSCTIAGKTLVAAGSPARLVISAVRVPDGAGDEVLPPNSYLCRAGNAALHDGKVEIQDVEIEAAGPIRATVCMRGYVLLEDWGATLPEEPSKATAPGRVPFSLRLSFYRHSSVIYGQHQIVFTGEPDKDFIARWAIELPGQAGPKGRLILEPGVEMECSGELQRVSAEQSRLCWAPVKDGFALIRKGWENRPCAVVSAGGAASIEFWPAQAGLWDLRRYAREWAVGGTGDTTKPELMAEFAKYAAYGIAKSHDFVICADQVEGPAKTPPMVRALSGRALLLAQPDWYAFTEALGPLAAEQKSGPLAPLDARTRRRMDYYLFCQDLYQWYGKVNYGFWQTRFGQVHRIDRWERDWGRWAWSLNDGAGRIGHGLMLQFLRTLERRYFEAGEAFNRANYDTNMVHTEKHLEIAYNWWRAKGNSHRHDVQPFSETYIGMRGSYPVGQRILHLLTGDGVIADGLEIVAETAFRRAEGDRSALCHSPGSDGLGSAANALLWKYETTGEQKYLDACRKILDASRLVPPGRGGKLGYGPSFGLFSAAGEYAVLSGDEAFKKRVIETGRLGARQKGAGRYLSAIAMAVRFSNDPKLRARLAEILKNLAAGKDKSLAELPVKRWPGHAGFREARFDANLLRDYACAIGVLKKAKPAGRWPVGKANAKAIPAEAPENWYRPGGAQKDDETVPAPEVILASPAVRTEPWQLQSGQARWSAAASLCDKVEVAGASPLAGGIVPYVELADGEDGSPVTSKFERLTGAVKHTAALPKGLIAADGTLGPGHFSALLRKAAPDGVPAVRVELACMLPQGSGRVVSWGLMIPLKFAGDGHAIQTTGPGRFRLERCRLDQNDERIPTWRTSEYHWPKDYPLWPKWRVSGINVGPGRYYRIWRANREDSSALVCDQGRGDGNWLDVTDRGGKSHWGVTARLLRSGPAADDTGRQAIRVNLETGLMLVQFHDPAAAPLGERAAARLAGAVDIIFHDGWRPPLAKPELTRSQYEKFLDDLNYGGNYGLFAYRFCLSTDHTVKDRKWVEKIRDLGIEPREILYSMLWKEGLAKHCKRIGVKWNPNDVEGSVRRVIAHYRR